MLELFVLKGRTRLVPDPEPTEGEKYDRVRQLWIDVATGQPLVNGWRADVQGSAFGETTLTRSREGADQTELTTLDASRFGETTLTKTFEGQDQGESVSSWDVLSHAS